MSNIFYEGLTFNGRDWGFATSTWTALNHFYRSYSVSGNKEVDGIYRKIDRGASGIIKKMASDLGVKASASAGSAKIAELILKQVLGDKYLNPTRGASQDICNHAIIDDYLLEHVYENDGWGNSDSIKKNAHIYIKQ